MYEFFGHQGRENVGLNGVRLSEASLLTLFRSFSGTDVPYFGCSIGRSCEEIRLGKVAGVCWGKFHFDNVGRAVWSRNLCGDAVPAA